MSGVELLRGMILHTPRNPFTEQRALKDFADGGLAIAFGRILAVGDYASVRASHPEAVVTDNERPFSLIPSTTKEVMS